MKRFLEFLIPRFVTDEVAFEERADGYYIVCCVDDLEPWEEFAALGDVRCFSWLGFGWFPQQIGELRPFVNPHSRVVTA